MAGIDTQKKLLSLIRDLTSERSRGEQRVVGLKKRIESLRSEVESANLEVEKAKRIKEVAEEELNGYEVELSLNDATIQSLEARIKLLQDEVSTVGNEVDALKNKEGLLRDQSAAPSDSVSVNAAYHTNPRQPKVQCNKITENYVSKKMWSFEDCLLIIDLYVEGFDPDKFDTDPDKSEEEKVKPMSHQHRLEILKEARASFRQFIPGNRIALGDLLRLLSMKQTHEEFGIIRELILLCKDKARRGVNIPKTLDFLPRTEEEIQQLRSYLAQFSSYSFSAYQVLNRLTPELSYKTACILRRIVHCLFRDFMKKLQDEDAAVVEIAPAPAKKGARKPAAAKPPQRLAEAEDQDEYIRYDAAVVEIAPAKKGGRKQAAAKPHQRLAEAEDQDYDAAVVEIAPAKKGGRKQAAAKAKPPPAPRRQGNQPKIVTDQKSSSVTERFAEAEDQDKYTQYDAAVVEVAPAKKGGRKQAAAKAKTPPAPRRKGNQPEIVTDQKSSSVTERFAEAEEITLDTKTRSRPKRDIRRPKRYDE